MKVKEKTTVSEELKWLLPIQFAVDNGWTKEQVTKTIDSGFFHIDDQAAIEKAWGLIKEFGPDLSLHSARVALYAMVLVDRMRKPAATAAFYGGLLHDVGKTMIPKSVLDKPASLTPSEFAIVKEHPRLGYEYLKKIGMKSKHVLHAVFFHHARADHQGYPAIEHQDFLTTSAVSIADAFDAMTSRRAYKNAMECSDALKELRQGSGSYFDPHLVDLFSSMNFQSLLPIHA